MSKNKSIKMARNRANINSIVKKVEQSIHVIGLSSYTRPEVSENGRNEWVEYGDENDYFDYLIDRYNGSPTNNAAINGISEMIYGKGLDATDNKEKPTEYAEMKQLF